MRMLMRMLMTIILMAHYVMLRSARYFPDPGLFCPDPGQEATLGFLRGGIA